MQSFPMLARAAAAALAAGLCSLGSHAQQPVITTVDSSGIVGASSSLALSVTGPVVAYYDATNGDLKLATCTSACDRATASWTITTIDSAGDVGRSPSLVAGSGGNVVAYYDATNAALKLAVCSAPCSATSPWVTTTVDRNGIDAAVSPSLGINGAGNPVIAYREATGRDLKVATCVANCVTAAPTWIFTLVDGPGDVGRSPSMQMINGRPVVAYLDAENARVKLALCTAACDTTTPSWTLSTIDTAAAGVETQVWLRINEGFPVVSYYDAANRVLKLATCLSNCGSASPTWDIAIVDSAGDTGQWNTLILNGGRPSLVYFATIRACNSGVCHEASDLRLAIRGGRLGPTFAIRTIEMIAGRAPSMQRSGDSVFVSYQEATTGHLKVAFIQVDELASMPQHTALWWDSQESGWGINFNHQGDIIFGTLFTYDSSGQPMWLVATASKRSNEVFSGTLYRTTGPAFNAAPFTPIGSGNITAVGTLTVAFADEAALLTYDVNGVVVNKALRKEEFGSRAASCFGTTQDRSRLTNYQDLWWNPAESGWGMNLTHQDDTIFATLFTYDSGGGGSGSFPAS